jgi:hypothetical protein
MSYLNDIHNPNEYISLTNDWDLDAAFLNSSNPYLYIKIEPIHTTRAQSIKPMNPDQTNKSFNIPVSTSFYKQTDILYEEWDVISSNDLQMKQLHKTPDLQALSIKPETDQINENYEKSSSFSSKSTAKCIEPVRRSKTYGQIDVNGKSLMSIWSNQYADKAVSVFHRMFNISKSNSLNCSSTNSSNSMSTNNSYTSVNNSNNQTNNESSANQHQNNQKFSLFDSLNQSDLLTKGSKQPLCETEFRNFLDSDGRIVQMQELKQRIYEGRTLIIF